IYQNSWNVFWFDINNDVQHAAAKLDDDVQHAAAELDDNDWKEPYIIPCESEFKTKNREKPKNIPMNAFRFDKYISVETGKPSRATSTRQSDQQLPLILAINATGISINEEGICLENKDLPEEISFSPDDIQ
ncbi:8979_t:CDS:2, partial [Gigaspora margarita]